MQNGSSQAMDGSSPKLQRLSQARISNPPFVPYKITEVQVGTED